MFQICCLTCLYTQGNGCTIVPAWVYLSEHRGLQVWTSEITTAQTQHSNLSILTWVQQCSILVGNACLLEVVVSPMGRLSLRRRAIVNLGGEGGLCKERVSSLETSWGSIESLLLLCSHTQTPRWPFPRLLLQWQLLSSNNNGNNV